MTNGQLNFDTTSKIFISLLPPVTSFIQLAPFKRASCATSELKVSIEIKTSGNFKKLRFIQKIKFTYFDWGIKKKIYRRNFERE